jgi:YbbR domain-containing protein
MHAPIHELGVAQLGGNHVMFIRNLPLKIASLFIALVLAYAVQRASNVSVVSLFVPLEIKNTPEDRVVVKPTKRGAQVTIKGPSFIVGPLAAAPPPLRVKLPDGVEDRASVTLRASDLSLPPTLEVISIEPSQVEFVLEPLERQEIRVAVPRIGQLGKELVLEGIEVSPPSIVVRGPRSELKALKTIETEPIDLGSIGTSKDVSLSIRSVGGSVTPESKTVLARVTIGEQPSVRSFSQIPVEVRVIGGASRGFTVTPRVVALTVSGSPSTLSGLQERDLAPYVRLNAEAAADTEGTREQVQMQLPMGLRVVSIEPAVVAVQQKSEAPRTRSVAGKGSGKGR